MEPLVDIAILSEDPPLLHRAAVALQRLFHAHADHLLGPPTGTPAPLDPPTGTPAGAEPSSPPAGIGAGQGLVALGALLTLSSCSVPPAAAAAAATLSSLRQSRPDVQMPPPEAVAAVVQSIRQEKARRDAEIEAETLAEEEAQEGAEGRAVAGGGEAAGGGDGGLPVARAGDGKEVEV